MRVLVAIPVFNEQRYVSRVLAQVLRITEDVLVVDDGSTDGTADLLAEHAQIDVIHHDSNLGYGRSLLDAFNHARRHGFDWVITMDCDDQHEPARIPAFVERAEADDVDIGPEYRSLFGFPSPMWRTVIYPRRIKEMSLMAHHWVGLWSSMTRPP